MAKADAHIDPSLDLESEIVRLKRERNAVVLAHYYQDSDIQDVADFLGDSLQLAQEAKKTKADVICFAGVHFMAETAKILNPDRIVVIPDVTAGCSLADGCPAPRFRAWRARYPEAVAVSYINCSAAVKAESDYICTSSNAEKIVRAIPEDKTILFAPDRNLGRHVEKLTGRKMIHWQGSCLVHETFSERKIISLKERHPGAEIIAHPECESGLLLHASFIGSTTALLKYAVSCEAKTLIVATEPGILHQMKKAAPDKEFIPAPPQNERCACNECPHMKKNTLEKVYLALRDLEPRIEMSEGLRERARVPIDRMLALSLKANLGLLCYAAWTAHGAGPRMAKNRIFFPQEALNAWLVDGHVELTDEQLHIKAENRRYRITEAAHVVREVTGTPDESDLVGRVKSKGYLAELGAELMESSMILGDNAYDVVPGFLGTPIGTFADHLKSNPVASGKEVKLQSEEDLLGAFLLRVL